MYSVCLLTLQLFFFLFPSTVCRGRSLPFLPLDLLEQEASAEVGLCFPPGNPRCVLAAIAGGRDTSFGLCVQLQQLASRVC